MPALTTKFDGKAKIGLSVSSNFDGKARIKDETFNIFDGKVKIVKSSSDVFDGKAKVGLSAANVFDGKARIKDETFNVFDGKAQIKDETFNVFDGKAQIKDETFNVFDGKAFICKSYNSDIDSGITGGPHSQADSAISGLPLLQTSSGIRGLLEDLTVSALSGIKGILTKDLDIDSGIRGLGETGAKSGILGLAFSVARSGIIGGFPSTKLIDRIWAVFNHKNMDNISSVSSQVDLITVLRILFDYDYARQTFNKAVQLEVKESTKKYGKIEKEIEAYWLSSFRTALQMGERILKHHCRPIWKTSFTSGLDYADIPPGEWVMLEDHLLLPISGQVLVVNAPLDLSAGEVSFTVEKAVSGPAEVEITGLSEAYEPMAPEGITITYRDGTATFTILDELNRPLSGASVTLDGTDTRTTDVKGQVQFITARGRHLILIEAAGYASLEFEVLV